MGNSADDLMKNGKTVLFAFEEAIGYMCEPQVIYCSLFCIKVGKLRECDLKNP